MEMAVEMAAAARVATTFSSVPERKREGGRVPVMEVRLILSCARRERRALAVSVTLRLVSWHRPTAHRAEQCRLGGGARAGGRGAFSISELAEKRASGSVPERSVLSTLISSRLVRRPSCGGMVPIRPAMLRQAILRISSFSL